MNRGFTAAFGIGALALINFLLAPSAMAQFTRAPKQTGPKLPS